MSDYAKLKELASKATKGDWFTNSYSRVQAHASGETEKQALAAYDAAGRPLDAMGHTPIEWRERFAQADYTVCRVPHSYGDTATGRHRADMDYIAAADPQTVLGLLERIERYEVALKKIAKPALGGKEQQWTAREALKEQKHE